MEMVKESSGFLIDVSSATGTPCALRRLSA